MYGLDKANGKRNILIDVDGLLYYFQTTET